MKITIKKFTQSIILTISQNDIHVWLEVCGKNKDGNVIACPRESKRFVLYTLHSHLWVSAKTLLK